MLLVLMVAILLAVTAASCGNAPAGSAVRLIAFASHEQSGRIAPHRLYVVAPDGSGLRLLVRDTEGDPTWSPDGSRIAFERKRDTGCDYCTDIYTIGYDGSDERRLTDDRHNAAPSWSPDGKLIAFLRCEYSVDLSCSIARMRDDGEGLRQLTASGDYGSPAWSPDGTKIAFARANGISVIAADGRGLQQVTKGRADSNPTWSPDSIRLAFERGVQLAEGLPGLDIYVTEVYGGSLRRLTRGPTTMTSSSDVAWSPDGKEVAFREVDWGIDTHTICGKQTLSLVSVDGSAKRRLTPYRAGISRPAWSPEGEQIAVAEMPTCKSQVPGLYVLSPADGDERLVSTDVPPDGGVAWQPGSGEGQ